jgi:recombination protein RecR
MRYSPSVTQLIAELAKLPGIGSKSAQRLAFHILSMEKSEVKDLTEAIISAHHNTRLCRECQNYTDEDPCSICSDSRRDRGTICVVESPKDVSTIERTREYKGLYHVLHGVYSPLQSVGLDALKIKELFSRLQKQDEVREVILATNQTAEGEATAMYISRLIKPSGIKVTRIASGLPMGSDIEFADDITLSKALKARHDF